MQHRIPARFLPVFAAIVLVATYLVWPHTAYGATAIRINTGGPSQTVNGTFWSGCTSTTACNGYVSGGFPWAENPTTPISGVVSPDSQTIEKSEWSGGSTNGVAYGATAFTYAIPVPSGTTYNVRLHFTELNKFAAGQRVFDVRVNNVTVLSNFDIYTQAGGAYRTIVRSFTASPDSSGRVVIAFNRKIENAKISAIEVLSNDGTTTTSSTTAPTTTSTTSAPSTGNNLSWSAIANSPQRAVESTGGTIDGKLYVFGGYMNNVWVPDPRSYVFDTATNSWSSLPNVPRSITHAANVIDGRSFIIAGGYTNNFSGGQTFAINNVWRFNVDTRTWSNLPSLPAAHGSGAMAKVGSVVHFFGGVDTNRREQNSHWTLDLNNTGAGWQSAGTYPYPRTHFAAVTIGTSIYTFGGLVGIDASSTQLSGVYRYDTITKTWSTRRSLPIGLSHISDSTVYYGGKVWVFGGEVRFGNGSRTVHVYDPNADSWTTSTQMPGWRFSGVAANIGGRFYFATGEMGSNTAWRATIN